MSNAVGNCQVRPKGHRGAQERLKLPKSLLSGRIMYLPTRSASFFVFALTRLWTLNPVCRQERRRSAHSGLRSSLRTRKSRTSLAKISARPNGDCRARKCVTYSPAVFIPTGPRRWATRAREHGALVNRVRYSKPCPQATSRRNSAWHSSDNYCLETAEPPDTRSVRPWWCGRGSPQGDSLSR